MRSIITLLLSFTLYFQSYGQSKVLHTDTYQLENGLTVLLNEDSTATKIFGAVLVNAGSKHEDPSATGMAHYLEHMLFKGTETLGTWDYEKEKPFLDSIRSYYDSLALTDKEEKRKEIQKTINRLALQAAAYGLPNELDKLLKSIGSTSINAFTTYDMTFFHNSFPSHEINRWLDLYATRFQHPVFRSFQSELEVVYEEKNRAMDSFERKIFEKIMAEMYPNLPYGQWSVLGKVEDLKNPSLNEMYDFYYKHYVPGNMALVLTGNFDSEIVKPMIAEKFGAWEARPVPQQEFPEPTPFDGTKVVKTRMTPVRAGLLGFQTPPYDHPDRVAASICEFLFYNEAKTGTINEVDLDGKLLYTGAFSLIFNDVGTYLAFYVPKLFGQTLGRAEHFIEAAMDEVRKGKFTDQELAAAKKQVSREFQEVIENLTQRGVLIGGAFNAGLPWDEVLSVPQKAETVTREDIIRVANTYYGQDHLKIISRMGFGKKNKLEKPPYKPVVTDQSKESSYAKSFEEMSALPFNPKFLDFKNDISRDTLSAGHTVVTAINPINKLFSLEIQFQKGTISDPRLEYVAKAANYAGTRGQGADQLKQAFASVGAEYRFYTTINTFVLKIDGNESALKETLLLAKQLLHELKIGEQAQKVMANNEKAERRLEKRSPGAMASALLNYATYGDDSYYCRRLSMHEIKHLKSDEMQRMFEEVTDNFQTEIEYSGTHSALQLGKLVKEYLDLPEKGEAYPYQVRNIQPVENTKILLVKNKKGVQSHVYFFQPVAPLGKDDYTELTAFNEYFGGGFSGLVTQEIREYRSLAYSTSSGLYSTLLQGAKNRFISYIGCQSDKTTDAIEVMKELIEDMPERPDRIPTLQQTLKQSVVTDYPDFKNIANKILMFERMGYDSDPNEEALAGYENLEMEDISNFYEENIQGKPYIIAIYGDPSRIDMKALRKIAPVKRIKLKEVVAF